MLAHVSYIPSVGFLPPGFEKEKLVRMVLLGSQRCVCTGGDGVWDKGDRRLMLITPLVRDSQ